MSSPEKAPTHSFQSEPPSHPSTKTISHRSLSQLCTACIYCNVYPLITILIKIVYNVDRLVPTLTTYHQYIRLRFLIPRPLGTVWLMVICCRITDTITEIIITLIQDLATAAVECIQKVLHFPTSKLALFPMLGLLLIVLDCSHITSVCFLNTGFLVPFKD